MLDTLCGLDIDISLKNKLKNIQKLILSTFLSWYFGASYRNISKATWILENYLLSILRTCERQDDTLLGLKEI